MIETSAGRVGGRERRRQSQHVTLHKFDLLNLGSPMCASRKTSNSEGSSERTTLVSSSRRRVSLAETSTKRLTRTHYGHRGCWCQRVLAVRGG